MLGSLLTLVLVVAVLSALAAALLVVPFVQAVDMAERRGFSTWRWGGLQLLALGLAVLGGYGLRHHNPLVLLPFALLCWVVPGALALLSQQDQRIGGRQGAHEA